MNTAASAFFAAYIRQVTAAVDSAEYQCAFNQSEAITVFEHFAIDVHFGFLYMRHVREIDESAVLFLQTPHRNLHRRHYG